MFSFKDDIARLQLRQFDQSSEINRIVDLVAKQTGIEPKALGFCKLCRCSRFLIILSTYDCNLMMKDLYFQPL